MRDVVKVHCDILDVVLLERDPQGNGICSIEASRPTPSRRYLRAFFMHTVWAQSEGEGSERNQRQSAHRTGEIG